MGRVMFRVHIQHRQAVGRGPIHVYILLVRAILRDLFSIDSLKLERQYTNNFCWRKLCFWAIFVTDSLYFEGQFKFRDHIQHTLDECRAQIQEFLQLAQVMFVGHIRQR